MPGGSAGHDGSRARLDGDPGSRVYGITPQVEHVLPLPDDSRDDRSELDAYTNLPVKPNAA
jgi:hypothetical protein